MLESLGLTGIPSVVIPYVVFSAAIAAVVLGLRTGFPTLQDRKTVSTILPLVLGAIGGYLIPELHVKNTSAHMGALYGLLAGSFSAPIYHAVRRLVAMRLKGNSKNPEGGMETTFAADVSAPQIKAQKKPQDEKKEETKPVPLTKDDDE